MDKLFIISVLLISFNTFAEPTVVGCTDTCRKTIVWTGCGISKVGYMQDLADHYGKKHNVRFELSGGGATKGIRDVVAGKVHFGGMCRLPLLGDIDGAVEEKDSILLPIAWDPLVVIVHKDNPVNSITSENLKKLLIGEIKRWDELDDSGGQNTNIDLYVRRGNISGVGLTLRQILYNKRDLEFSKDALRLKSSGEIEKTVVENSNAIAVTGFSSASKRNGLKILKLDGVENTIENLKNGKYPIYRQLLLTFMKESLIDEDVADFVLFTRSLEAIIVIRKTGTLPYTDGLKLTYNLEGPYLDDIFQLDSFNRYNPKTNRLKNWINANPE